MELNSLEDIEERLVKSKSRLERWILTMHFKRVSKTTYMVIKVSPLRSNVKIVWLILTQSVSDRVIDQHIRSKLREATGLRGFSTSLLFGMNRLTHSSATCTHCRVDCGSTHLTGSTRYR